MFVFTYIYIIYIYIYISAYALTIDPAYNDSGLRNTSSIATDILLIQICVI